MAIKDLLQGKSKEIETEAFQASPEKENLFYEIKRKIHGRLVEEANLAALDSLDPSDIRQEIQSVVDYFLQEEQVLLNNEEKVALTSEIIDELMGLGPLVGTRTWGGVIGISPRHRLVDGTQTTQPEFSFWFEDVGWGVENYGTDPDIEVDITPNDYAQGVDAQLARAIAEVQSLLEANPPQIPDLSQRPSKAAPRLPR